MAHTFNDQLLDDMIAHQIGVLRFSGSVRNKIWKALDATEADIKAQIKAAGGIGIKSQAQIRLRGWKAAREEWFSDIHGLAQAEPEFLQTVIAGAVPVQLGTTLPSSQALRDIVTSRPFEGKTLKEWADNIQRADLARIEDQIKIGLIQNESLPQISRRIVGTVAQRGRDGVTQITRRHAATITRTVVSGVASDARQQFLSLNKDIAPKKLFVATLDSRTTKICMRFDGSVWDVDDPNAPVFPLHFGERSLYSPSIDGVAVGDRPRRDFTQRQLVREFGKEFGVKVKVPKGATSRAARAAIPRGQKGAFDEWSRGRMRELTGTTAAKTTYQTWLGRRTAAQQSDILGPTRAALFRKGDLTLDKFVMADGTELTLSQLATRNAAAFRRANLDPEAFR